MQDSSQKDGRPLSTSDTFLGIHTSQLHFVVRPFTLADYHSVISRIRFAGSDEKEFFRNSLNHYMSKMPTSARATIPCVCLLQDDGDSSYVVSIPSLNIVLDRVWLDVRISFKRESELTVENKASTS